MNSNRLVGLVRERGDDGTIMAFSRGLMTPSAWSMFRLRYWSTVRL